MFTMLGSDGNEYGPVTVTEIKRWVAQGRADANTQLKRVGEATWNRLGDLPEFTGRPPPLPGAFSSEPPISTVSLSSEPVLALAPLDVFDCFDRSWVLFKNNLGPSVGATLITVILTFLADRIPSNVGVIASSLISSVLFAGYNYYFLKQSRGETAKLADLFIGFRAALVGLLLVTLVSCILVFLGFALFIVPGIYLGVGYAFAALLVVDKKLSFWPALETSRRVVSAQWWRVLGLLLLCTFVSAVGILALGIGVILTIPIATGALVYGYEHLFRDAPSA
jgi:hypothetical protein